MPPLVRSFFLVFRYFRRFFQSANAFLTYAEGCANLSGNVEELESHVDEGFAIDHLAQRSALVQRLWIMWANCRGGRVR